MKDYYKIGEISKIYNIGRDSLMYYEELGILKPFRDKNGYRMYSIEDIWKLNMIKEFRIIDFSMKNIKDYLDDRKVDSTINVLTQGLDIIDKKIEELNKHKKNIENRLVSINQSTQNIETEEVKVNHIKSRRALILNAHIKKDEDFDILIKKLQKEHEGKFDIIGNSDLGAVFSKEALKSGIYNQFESVICFLKDDEENYDIVFEEGYYATLNYRGEYSKNRNCLDKINSFIENSNYEIIGSPIEIYKIDIHETGLVEEFITEIQVPMRKI